MRRPSMLRRLTVIAATVFLVMVVVWLASKPITRFTLGPGERLICRPGVNLLLVGDGSGGWRRFDGAARAPEHGRDLPADIRDRPAVGPAGGTFALTPTGLLRIDARGEVQTVVPANALPAGVRLEGVPGSGPALLSVPAGDRRALMAPSAGGDRLIPLAVAKPGGGSAPLTVPVDAELICSVWSLAVASLGPQGWEAWTPTQADDPHMPWRRVLAPDCRDPGAVFSPDGLHLIVPGAVDGLWLLELATGGLGFMAEGNLGYSRRVPHGVGFSQQPDPVLWSGQWSVDRVLHVCTAHLGGGGRNQLKIGRAHDYNPTLSWDGGLVVYCQAEFDESGDEPFDEALYCLDRFQTDLPAVYVDDRQAGRPDQGPHFVGTSDAFVYVANGEVRGVVLQRPAIESPP